MRIMKMFMTVFSAYAEVVPLNLWQVDARWGILRVRGGSSHGSLEQYPPTWYSPRTRR